MLALILEKFNISYLDILIEINDFYDYLNSFKEKLFLSDTIKNLLVKALDEYDKLTANDQIKFNKQFKYLKSKLNSVSKK